MHDDDDVRAGLLRENTKSKEDREENNSSNGKSKSFKLFWAGAMLFSGTFTTITAKALFESKATGLDTCNMDDNDDKFCEFNKPWFTVLIMKLSMSLCLFLYYGLGWGKDDMNAPYPSWTTI